MKFSDLQLEPALLESINKLGYSECTSIQAEAMPHIVEGRDVAGLAQTGTGKTAAFLIPLMDRILKARNNHENKARAFSDWQTQHFILILVPTRELAEQVQDNIQKLSEHSGLRGCAVYGGTSYDKQKEAVKNNVEFIAATPGRLIDLYKEHIIDLKQVRAIVFDEADRMFDMGFKDDMKFILSRVPRERQFLVFSATLNFDVLNTAYQFGSEPVEVNISRDHAKADNVKDEIFHVGEEEKPAYLLSLLKKQNPKQAIIFSNFKFNVERLAKFLSINGIPAMGISSLLTQAQRTRVIEQFKAENAHNILVATDVAARGLDIKGVDLVINYELPNDAESYVHRIGRTGRAGTLGQAYSLVCDKDVESMSRVEDYLKHKLATGWLEESEIVKDFKPVPRDYDSGAPRGDRPERSGGSDRPRGPRQDNRPPRRDNRNNDRHAGGNRDNRERRPHGDRQDRPHSDRPHQGDRPQRRDHGPRDNNREQNRDHRGPRQEGRPPRPQGQHQQNARPNGRHPNNNNNQRRDQNNRRPNQRPNQQKAPVAQAGVVQKIKGFFKNLFE